MSRVSVCMASYNGASYIEQQLKSILIQLRENDELILVDDCSTDSTLDVIRAISDPRILIFKNIKNLGVRKSFEKSISESSGDIIFLSDQDDIWNSGKVEDFLNVFDEDPSISLVLSDAQIIDSNGIELVASFFQRRGGFATGVLKNMIKNRYLGCVIAFRSNLLTKALPFPQGIPQHDMWLGLVNEVYGKSFFIDKALVQYRRHSSNASTASSNKRGSVRKMLYWRWMLIYALTFRVITLFFKNRICKKT